jgi:hypothetical protein
MWSNRTWKTELDRKSHLKNDYQSMIPKDSAQGDSSSPFQHKDTASLSSVLGNSQKAPSTSPNATLSSISFPVTITMPPGGRLTLLSLKYYGHKAFWVYIYLANKSRINDPDRIPAGTSLLIPKPDPIWMNPDNPEAVRKAISMQSGIKAHP